MIAGGAATAALARDTVFATLMIILTGMVGICLLVGAMRHREQTFGIDGVTGALTTLATIAVLTLILPNYDTHVPGPVYGPGQLAFIALVSLVLYGTFVLVQTVRHRGYFLEASPSGVAVDAPPPSDRATALSATLLLVCLAAVVLLAKKIAPTLESAVARAGAPPALVGVIIAGVVLMPEGIAAVRAARQNRLQTSLNLALGSALASIGLDDPRGRDRVARDRTHAHARHRRQEHGAARPLALRDRTRAAHGEDDDPPRHGAHRDLRCLSWVGDAVIGLRTSRRGRAAGVG